jgi:hypothetical protein
MGNNIQSEKNRFFNIAHAREKQFPEPGFFPFLPDFLLAAISIMGTYCEQIMCLLSAACLREFAFDVVMLRAAKHDIGPKPRRGLQLIAPLALRVGMNRRISGRAEYIQEFSDIRRILLSPGIVSNSRPFSDTTVQIRTASIYYNAVPCGIGAVSGGVGGTLAWSCCR